MSDLVQKIADSVREEQRKAAAAGQLDDIEGAIRQVIASQPQERGEAVAWQFYQDGKWWNGLDTNNHRANTEAVGIPTRDLYPAPTDTGRVAELEAQIAESRERVARAYGLLWHVNAGIDAPWGTPSLTPERAAMESRKVLRDMLTYEQRGDGINAARDIMKALAADQEKK